MREGVRSRFPRNIIGNLLPVQKMCLTKQVRSKSEASRFANQWNTALAPGEPKMKAYHCSHCGGYHCGHESRLTHAVTA